MRHSCVLLVGILCCFLSFVIGSYDAGYGAAHDHDDYEPSYAAPPIVHQPHGHSAGSYYHYHVPLVGQQQQHYQPYPHHHDHSHYLWPLLLLLALPLLFLPLLPLLLLPLGISLLALLAPGGMMMMMMMMMMGGGMMMRSDTVSGRALNEMRTFGDVLFTDMTSLFAKYARSLDLDQCPQRIACELGAIFLSDKNGTETADTAKAFTSFIMEQYIPKGKVKRTIKQFEKAFWKGSTIGSCNSVFHCQPTFRIYQNSGDSAASGSASSIFMGLGSPSPFTKSNTTRMETAKEHSKDVEQNKKNYVYPTSKVNAIKYYKQQSTTLPPSEATTGVPKPKIKRSHFSRYGSYSWPLSNKAEDNEIAYNNNINEKYISVFGTPTVKS